MNYNHGILDQRATNITSQHQSRLQEIVEYIPYFKTAHSSKVLSIDLNIKDQNGLTLSLRLR